VNDLPPETAQQGREAAASQETALAVAIASPLGRQLAALANLGLSATVSSFPEQR
jgi:hypothetical protein